MSINITNILSTTPYDLAIWSSQSLLNIRLPAPGVNHTLNVQLDVLPLVSEIANRMALATELYNICVGAKAPWSIAKRGTDKKVEAETTITTLSAHIDILYRSIQTLDALRESASRLITGANQASRVNGY